MIKTLTALEADALTSLRLAHMKLGWAIDEAEGDEKHRLRGLWIKLDAGITGMENGC